MHAKSTRNLQFLAKLTGITLVASLTISVTATTYHVDGATGNDSNDGESWPQAYKTPQKALLNPELTAGDQIWVAVWTYYPDECDTCGPAGTDNRADSYYMVEDVSIFGGFLNGDAFEDRDPEANETILSGDIQQDADQNNFSFHVVTFLGLSGEPGVLDGFTVTRGNANGDPFLNMGGGVLVVAADAIIRKCRIHDNKASIGGGLKLLTTSGRTVRVRDCVFTGNQATSKGGALSTLDSGDTAIVKCRFSQNQAADEGGAINITATLELTAVNCEFIENSSREGGAIHLEAGSAGTTVANSLFVGNTADDHGGAVDVGSPITLINCTLTRNSVLNPPPNEGGGAIFVEGSSLVIVRNGVLWDNTVGTDPPMPNQIFVQSGSADVSYSDVQGDLWPGIGNINDDPLFIPGRGFYQLMI